MRRVGTVMGCELLVQIERGSEVYYVRVPEEGFGYGTTRTFRRLRVGAYGCLHDAEKAARRCIGG